jgi:hypothetical protein
MLKATTDDIGDRGTPTERPLEQRSSGRKLTWRSRWLMPQKPVQQTSDFCTPSVQSLPASPLSSGSTWRCVNKLMFVARVFAESTTGLCHMGFLRCCSAAPAVAMCQAAPHLPLVQCCPGSECRGLGEGIANGSGELPSPLKSKTFYICIVLALGLASKLRKSPFSFGADIEILLFANS